MVLLLVVAVIAGAVRVVRGGNLLSPHILAPIIPRSLAMAVSLNPKDVADARKPVSRHIARLKGMTCQQLKLELRA